MLTTRSEWLAEVDRTLRGIFCIDHVDAGWSDDETDRYFAYGMSPKEFGLWFGEKYDLIRLETYRAS
jgi:hypothetical protein